MPDWLLHIGAADALARPRWRFDARWLFLGAVLPDAIPRVAGMAMHVFPFLRPLDTLAVSLWLGLLHTPFSVGCLAAALLCLAADRRAAARGLIFGAVLHFAMDLGQRSFGGGTALLFPVALRSTSAQLYWYDSAPVHAAVFAAALYLAVVLWRRRHEPPAPFPFACSRRRLNAAALALAVALLTPGLCLQRAIEQNLGNALLARAPETFEGAVVAMSVTVVDHVDGDTVFVDEADRVFAVHWAGHPPLREGDFVSVRGTYRDQRLHPDEVFVHDYTFKSLASLVGLALLLWVWLPSLRRSGRDARGVTARTACGPARTAAPGTSCR